MCSAYKHSDVIGNVSMKYELEIMKVNRHDPFIWKGNALKPESLIMAR